jgi:hypothetical protein
VHVRVGCEVTELSEKEVEQKENHDACVRVVAEELKRANWMVKANVEGYPKPAAIGENHIPDVIAEKKGCVTRICEVATPEMFEGDIQKYGEFRNFCNEYDFHMYVVEKDGKRREIDPQTLGKK